MAIKVAIDAGHGSNTAGKRTPDGYREHYINVKTAYYLEQFLKKYGIETVRIGWNDTNATDDVDVALSTRQAQIKSAKCDYSISCHANAYGSGYNSAKGVETLISNTPSYQGDSLRLAKKVQAQLIKGTTQTNRCVKLQSLAMCNCSAMKTKASILCEIGFMTNEYESGLMKKDEFCKEQGEDIARGFLDYVGINYNVATTTTSKTDTTVMKNTKSSYVFNGISYNLVFDPTYYYTKYADLQKAFGTDATKLFNHFCNYGMKEGRQAIGTFNVNTYKSRYIDLQKAFGNDLPSYYKHYIQYGSKEGRSAI